MYKYTNMVYLCNVVLSGNKTERSTDANYNMGTLKTLCSATEAHHKGPHVVWFHLTELYRRDNVETESILAVAYWLGQAEKWGVTAIG